MKDIQMWSAWGSRSLVLAAIVVGASGCAVVGDIFKAGVWVAVIGMALVALIGFGIVGLFKKGG
jgi:hypothetical protein